MISQNGSDREEVTKPLSRPSGIDEEIRTMTHGGISDSPLPQIKILRKIFNSSALTSQINAA